VAHVLDDHMASLNLVTLSWYRADHVSYDQYLCKRAKLA